MNYGICLYKSLINQYDAKVRSLYPVEITYFSVHRTEYTPSDPLLAD